MESRVYPKSSEITSPIELLLLGSLRYMGRGWTFDDLEKESGINDDIHRQFFHQFIKYGKNILYSKYVKYLINEKDARNHMKDISLMVYLVQVVQWIHAM